jgi:hypothetical protein
MLSHQQQEADNKAKGAAQAAAENLKYQARKRADANAKVPDKLAKFLKTQGGQNRKK